jgi:hypothetical protein
MKMNQFSIPVNLCESFAQTNEYRAFWMTILKNVNWTWMEFSFLYQNQSENSKSKLAHGFVESVFGFGEQKNWSTKCFLNRSSPPFETSKWFQLPGRGHFPHNERYSDPTLNCIISMPSQWRSLRSDHPLKTGWRGKKQQRNNDS